MSTIRVVNVQHTDATEPNIVLLADGTSVFASGITISGGTNLTVSGTAEFASGTVSAPGVTFIDDNNTGLYSPAADTVAITTAATERLRVDSTGNVGIGATSPSRPLTVGGVARFENFIEFGGSISTPATAAAIYRPADNNLAFSTASTERMRIDSSGRVLVGTSSTSQNHTIQGFGVTNCAWFQSNTATSEVVAVYGGTASGNNIFIKFLTDNLATRGSIDYNRSAGQVRYNTTSDARLKSEIADSTTALNTLNNIRVRKYKWTETDYQVEHGFVAQELTGVVPEAVKVGDDGDEVTDIWAVDNSKLVPLLTKALQEAIAKIKTLEQRLSDAGIA